MTAKEFLKLKGRKEIVNCSTGDRTNEYLITPEQMTEFAKLPCDCTVTNYGYGAAKCFDCGRLREVGHETGFVTE